MAGRAAATIGGGCPIRSRAIISNSGVKAIRPVSAVQTRASMTVKRRSARYEAASRTSAMAVAISMMTGLSISSESAIVRPHAARFSGGSGNRPIAP